MADLDELKDLHDLLKSSIDNLNSKNSDMNLELVFINSHKL